MLVRCIVRAYDHPVEVILRSVRRMPQESLAGLAAAQGRQASEIPIVPGLPAQSFRCLRFYLAHIR
ncbi:hypothetical protein [Lysobacter gummosus]|uniref:hypothetical protein n=1 Tax=Lysobacter gummosus TaxID=262324 RepID=UPI00362CE3B4